MICFMDKTFCGYWQECASGKDCHRKLTETVCSTADLLDLAVVQYADRPDCFINLTRVGPPIADTPGKTPPRPPIRGSGTFPGKCWKCSTEADVYEDSELCQSCDERDRFYKHLGELLLKGDLMECPFVAGEELLKGCLDYGACVKCIHYTPVPGRDNVKRSNENST